MKQLLHMIALTAITAPLTNISVADAVAWNVNVTSRYSNLVDAESNVAIHGEKLSDWHRSSAKGDQADIDVFTTIEKDEFIASMSGDGTTVAVVCMLKLYR